MSVNAINAAEPQQKKSSAGSAVTAGIGLGAVGGTAGYFSGNKRPDLDKVFAMEPDTFETATKDAAEDVKNEIATIKEGRTAVEEAGKIDAAKQAAYDSALNNVAEKDVQAEADALKQAKEDAKAALDKANEGKADAEKLAKLADDAPEAKAVKKAEADLKNAKVKFIEGTTDDANKVARDAVKEYKEAFEAAKTNKANKIAELAKEEKYTSAFAKIKKMFPKEGGWKMAAIVGGIAAAVGIVASLMMGGKKEA